MTISHTPDSGHGPLTEDELETLAGLDAESRQRAQDTDCGVIGCDRAFHVGFEPPSEWVHRIREQHVDGVALHTFDTPDGAPTTEIYLDLQETHDSQGLRQLAERFRQLADVFLEEADTLDSRARRIRRPSSATDDLLDLEG